MLISVEEKCRRNLSFCSSSVGFAAPIRPALTSRSARLSKGLCVFALAWVNEVHSALFQYHRGTCKARSPSSGLTLKILASKREPLPPKAREYSPFGSNTMKRAFGLGLLLWRCDCAASSDQRIRPATVQDLPLPVLPSTARCRPKR